MANLDLFSIGNALVDQEFLVDDEFLTIANLQKGTMQLCDAKQQADLVNHLNKANHKGQASGGSAANTTVAFSALGGASFYACRVGNDALADFYLQDLQNVGVKTAPISLSEGQTGTCIVMISPDGERTMYTHLGITAELSTAQVDFERLKTAKWLYIEGYLATSLTAQQAVLQARQVAKEHGVKIALSLSDPAMVQYAKTGLDTMIADGVDVLFCNEQEALMYTQQESLEQACQSLAYIAKTVVITLGGKGAMIYHHAQAEIVAGFEAEAVDTNGAGDAFAGGFLYATNQGKDLATSAKFANLIASKVVAQFGPRLKPEQYQELAKQI